MQINCHVPNGPLLVPKFGTLRLTLNKVLKVAMCISLTKSYHESVAFTTVLGCQNNNSKRLIL